MISLIQRQENNLIIIISFASLHFLLSMLICIFFGKMSSYLCAFAIVSMLVNVIIIIFAAITYSSLESQLYSRIL